MSSRTVFLSRLIGLYCILIALCMMTRGQATVETVTALLQNPAMTLILGVITLAAGLAMVLVHNIWSGNALAVVVTLVGWMALIKSLFFLFLPPETEAAVFLGRLHYQQLFYLYAATSLVLGVYLTYGGSGQNQTDREDANEKRRPAGRLAPSGVGVAARACSPH